MFPLDDINYKTKERRNTITVVSYSSFSDRSFRGDLILQSLNVNYVGRLIS